MRVNITFGYALAIILVFFSSALCRADNLVYNGGFEKSSDDAIADGWGTMISRGTTAEIALDNEITHSGAAAFRIRFEGEGGRAMLFPEKDITDVTPGQTYEVSFWAKTRNLGYSPNFIAPSLQFNFSPKRISPYPVIDMMSQITHKGEWERLSQTATAPPGSEKLTFKIILTRGTIWIDDIVIQAVESE